MEGPKVSMDKDAQDRGKEAIGGQACVAGFKFLVAFDRSVPAGRGLAVHMRTTVTLEHTWHRAGRRRKATCESTNALSLCGTQAPFHLCAAIA